MFRTPNRSIRVPDVDDGSPHVALRDMMTDVEYLIDSYTARLFEVTRRRAVEVGCGGGTVIPNGVQTTITWTCEEYDPDNMFDIVGAPTRITLPGGVWMLNFNAVIMSAGGALSDAHLRVLGSVAGEVCSAIAPSLQTSANASASGLVFTTGEFFTAQVYQNSGGNGSISGKLGAIKVASL